MVERTYVASPHGRTIHITRATQATIAARGGYAWSICGFKGKVLGPLDGDQWALPACKSCKRVQTSWDRREHNRAIIAAHRGHGAASAG